MTHREVTRQSWPSRIVGSLKGIIFGLVVVAVSLLLLFWNEGRAVSTYRALQEGAGTVVSVPSDRVSSEYDGKLVHVTGLATTPEILADEPFGVSVNAIHLERQVEMYQWREDSDTQTEKKLGGSTETTTTFSYGKTWSDGLIDSKRFKEPAGHQNPDQLPYSSRRLSAQEVWLGAFRLSSGLVSSIDRRQPLSVDSLDKLPADLRWKTELYDNGFYVGRSPSSPAVGDLRVRFNYVPPMPVSVVARQIGNSFEPYVASNGRTVQLLRTGTVSAELMFESAQRSNKIITWLLRLVGFLLMTFGIRTVLAPIVVLADVIPALGNITAAGTRLVALGLSLLLSFITIAVAWIYYRPLLAFTLLVLAVAAGIGVWRLLRKAGRKTAGPPPVPLPPPS